MGKSASHSHLFKSLTYELVLIIKKIALIVGRAVHLS